MTEPAAPTQAPLLQPSNVKIAQLLDQLPTFVHASGNEGLIAAYHAAAGFGLDIPAAVSAMLPSEPAQLDDLLVTLAVQALRCRSDDASQVTIGVDGGELFGLSVAGVEYVATGAGDERSEDDGARSDVERPA